MAGKPRALGGHVYSGAWTLGFMDDFDVVGQFEELDAGWETVERNLGSKLKHYLGPSEEWPIDEYVDELDLFFANPPCAPWSAAGAKLGINDPRVQFSKNMADVALRLNPTFFVMESVPRAWSDPPRGGREVYTALAEPFFKQGYGVTIFFTNNVLHGAAQFRQRFHFIAHKLDLELRQPDVPTRETAPKVRDLIEDLEHTAVPFGETPTVPNHAESKTSDRARVVMSYMNAGEGWDVARARALAAGVEDPMKNRFVAGRTRYDAPAATVLDIGSMVHPRQDRYLTLREGARLCGYPDWYEFVGNKAGSAPPAAQVTQAVMPYIGRYLGREITRSLDRGKSVSGVGTINVVDFRPLAMHLSPSKYPIEVVHTW